MTPMIEMAYDKVDRRVNSRLNSTHNRYLRHFNVDTESQQTLPVADLLKEMVVELHDISSLVRV